MAYKFHSLGPAHLPGHISYHSPSALCFPTTLAFVCFAKPVPAWGPLRSSFLCKESFPPNPHMTGSLSSESHLRRYLFKETLLFHPVLSFPLESLFTFLFYFLPSSYHCNNSPGHLFVYPLLPAPRRTHTGLYHPQSRYFIYNLYRYP